MESGGELNHMRPISGARTVPFSTFMIFFLTSRNEVRDPYFLIRHSAAEWNGTDEFVTKPREKPRVSVITWIPRYASECETRAASILRSPLASPNNSGWMAAANA